MLPSITLRKSIVHLIIRILSLQVIFLAVYFPIVFPFFTIDNGFKILNYSLTNILFISLIFFQVHLTFITILNWLNDYYVIKPGEIYFKKGFLNKLEEVHLLKDIEGIGSNQNLLERIFNYGTIRLYNPIDKKEIDIHAINNPEKYIKIIQNAKQMIVPTQNFYQVSPRIFFSPI